MKHYDCGNWMAFEQAFPNNKEDIRDEEAERDYWAEMRELRRQEIEERKRKQFQKKEEK